jgi:hypothetical protein
MHERIVAPATHQLAAIVRRAVARGEITGRPPTSDVLLSLVLGPLHHRIVVRRRPVGPAFERLVVAQVAAGLRA